MTNDEYQLACRYGADSYTEYLNHSFDGVEPKLSRDCSTAWGTSSMDWERAKHAWRDTWHRAINADERAIRTATVVNTFLYSTESVTSSILFPFTLCAQHAPSHTDFMLGALGRSAGLVCPRLLDAVFVGRAARALQMHFNVRRLVAHLRDGVLEPCFGGSQLARPAAERF